MQHISSELLLSEKNNLGNQPFIHSDLKKVVALSKCSVLMESLKRHCQEAQIVLLTAVHSVYWASYNVVGIIENWEHFYVYVA